MRTAAILLAIASSSALSSAAAPQKLVAEEESVAEILHAMAEPPIGQLPQGDQVFRFIWLRSFHRPFLVQVEKRGEETTLVLKALDRPWSAGPDGIHVGTLTLTRRKQLPRDAWDRLADMRRNTFWGRASYDPSVESGADGAMWILEGRSWDNYHVVERWSPREGAFREMCLAMLELAGVDLAAERVY